MPTIVVSHHVEFIDFIFRLVVAIFSGFLIGLERQWINRVAGIQTNVLVSTGACIFILGSYFVSYEGQSASRIAAQIVSGIGFLGAGMIFRDGITTHGINTAATMWCAAAVGVLCGMGLIPHALTAVIVLIGANLIFRKIDHSVSKNRKWTDLRIIHQYEIQVIASKEQAKELKRKMLPIFEVEDCHLYSMKTTLAKQNFVKITASFKTRHLKSETVQKMSKKIEELSDNLLVDWSQLK